MLRDDQPEPTVSPTPVVPDDDPFGKIPPPRPSIEEVAPLDSGGDGKHLRD